MIVGIEAGYLPDFFFHGLAVLVVPFFVLAEVHHLTELDIISGKMLALFAPDP